MMLVQFMFLTCSSIHSKKLFAKRGREDLALSECNSFASAASRWPSQVADPYLLHCLLNFVGHIFSGKCFQCVCFEEVYLRRSKWTG